MLPTALTEILFSFVLVLAVFLFLRGNHIASAIMISFIPFARTEGFIMFPVFLLALWRARQFRAMPFLATGIVFFSLAGCFYFRDLFWVFTQFPYPVTYHHPVYNQGGSLWHFVEARDYILGLPLEILFLAGIVVIFRGFFSRDRIHRVRSGSLFMLVLFPFLFYVAFHAVLYWKAMGGSMGLERVLAAVLPLAGLVALAGYNGLEAIWGFNKYFRAAIMTMILAAVIVTPFRTYIFPYPLSPEEETIRNAASWLKTSSLNGRLFFYTDNNVPYYMDVDPYQESPVLCSTIATCKALDTLPAGSVLVWDAHFGANESKIPLDSLLSKPRQQLVNYFRPVEPWITFGGYRYECYITKTMQPGQLADNRSIRDSLMEASDVKDRVQTIFDRGFELPGDAWDTTYLCRDIVHRGRFSFIMDGRTEFGPGPCVKVSSLADKRSKSAICAAVYIFLPNRVSASGTLLVISFESKGKSYSYSSVNLNDRHFGINRWNRVSVSADLPEFRLPDDLLKVYIWNPGKQRFYMDDLMVDEVVPGKSVRESK